MICLLLEKEGGNPFQVLLCEADHVVLMQKDLKNCSPLRRWSQNIEKIITLNFPVLSKIFRTVILVIFR